MAAKILLVEDDPQDSKLIAEALNELQKELHIHVEKNGLDAVLYLKGEAKFADRNRFPIPDAILLDLHLPRFDGFEFLEWLRKGPARHRNIPVVVITGIDDPKSISRAYLVGANSVITKSTNWNQFVHALRDAARFWSRT